MYFVVYVLPGCATYDGLAIWGDLMNGSYASVIFCLGMCVLAPFCNYWLDTYRRKHIALWSLLGMLFCTALYMLDLPIYAQILVRLVQGSAYGVFQIALGSTLLLDLTDSKRRTEAAHVYYWFTRMALAFGPLAGSIMMGYWDFRWFVWMAVALLVLAVILLWGLKVPFRAPLEPGLVSLDRFWLARGVLLFIPLFLIMMSFGMWLRLDLDYSFYVLLLVGLMLALGMHGLFFREKMQTEIFFGLTSLLVSYAMYALCSDELYVQAAAVGIGMGIGWTASRFLLAYIRICQHCERGTAQTSYLLGWDAGLAFGCFVGYMQHVPERIPVMALATVGVAAVYYWAYGKRWYEDHKRK